MPAADCGALKALFLVDAAMGDVVRTTRETQLGPIRLAWWRERLEDLDLEGLALAEPRLQAVRRELIPRGVEGRTLAELEGGWLCMFDPFPWTAQIAEAIWFRGNLMFGIGAKVLGRADGRIQDAGGLWALVDVARYCSDADSRAMLIGRARILAQGLRSTRFPSRLRPLSMLAALAMRDCRRGEPFEQEGTPARALAMLAHRLSGRLPRRS